MLLVSTYTMFLLKLLPTLVCSPAVIITHILMVIFLLSSFYFLLHLWHTISFCSEDLILAFHWSACPNVHLDHYICNHIYFMLWLLVQSQLWPCECLQIQVLCHYDIIYLVSILTYLDRWVICLVFRPFVLSGTIRYSGITLHSIHHSLYIWGRCSTTESLLGDSSPVFYHWAVWLQWSSTCLCALGQCSTAETLLPGSLWVILSKRSKTELYYHPLTGGY